MFLFWSYSQILRIFLRIIVILNSHYYHVEYKLFPVQIGILRYNGVFDIGQVFCFAHELSYDGKRVGVINDTITNSISNDTVPDELMLLINR